jgi:hypothetical protein
MILVFVSSLGLSKIWLHMEAIFHMEIMSYFIAIDIEKSSILESSIHPFTVPLISIPQGKMAVSKKKIKDESH